MAKKPREKGETAGQQFVRQIGTVGCIVFLGMFVLFLITCFTS